jgi:hypothetical protein
VTPIGALNLTVHRKYCILLFDVVQRSQLSAYLLDLTREVPLYNLNHSSIGVSCTTLNTSKKKSREKRLTFLRI